MDIIRKRGRPRKYKTKSVRLSLRITKEDLDKMESACQYKGVSKTELVCRALKTYYDVMEYVD